MISTIKSYYEKVPVDWVLLFQLLSVTKTFQHVFEKFVEYEPHPL